MLEKLKEIRKSIVDASKVEIRGLSISKVKLKGIILKYGLENLYVGQRIDNYSNCKIFGLDDFKFPQQKRTIVTLFKHEASDEHYFDILDSNVECDMINNNMVFMSHGCQNLYSLLELTKDNKALKKIDKRG